MDGDVCVCVSGCLPACVRLAIPSGSALAWPRLRPRAPACLLLFVHALDWMGGLGRVWWLNGDGLQRSSQSPPFDISGTAFFLKPLKSHLCVCLAGCTGQWRSLSRAAGLFLVRPTSWTQLYFLKKVYSLPSVKRFRGRACSVRTIITG